MSPFAPLPQPQKATPSANGNILGPSHTAVRSLYYTPAPPPTSQILTTETVPRAQARTEMATAHPLQNPKYQYLRTKVRSSPPVASPPRVSSAPPPPTTGTPTNNFVSSPATTPISTPPIKIDTASTPPVQTSAFSSPYSFVSLTPQVHHSKGQVTTRPPIVIMPSHHGHVRSASAQYVTVPPHAIQIPTHVPTRTITPAVPGYTTPSVLAHPVVDRHRREAGVIPSGHPSVGRSHSVGHGGRRRGGRGYAHTNESDDSDDSETEYNSNINAATNFPFGSRSALPGVLNPLPPSMIPPQAPQVPRPPMRTRTSSSSTSATVHFNPDNLFVTFPSPHTIKLSNIPRFGASALIRNLKERVFPMWLPGMAYQKEGRGELIVGFAGLPEGMQYAHSGSHGHDMLAENDRKNWGIWTARGQEGIASLRLLTTMMATFAGHGLSYLAALHCLPPQLIFSTTPEDRASRFFCIEISVAPLPPKKTKVVISSEDPEREPINTKRKVKIDISRISIRCVDTPQDVLKTVVGAVRNSGRDGAGMYNGSDRGKGEKGMYDSEGEEEDEKYYSGRNELLEFGLQGERWEAKGVYHLESVISRGTGKRAVSQRDMARARHDKRDTSPLVEADTDQLPVLLSHVLKALSSHGYRLETSIPMPLPVPLQDPFSPYGPTARPSGISSFLDACFGGGDDGCSNRTRGYGREVWMFRSVDWFHSQNLG